MNSQNAKIFLQIQPIFFLEVLRHKNIEFFENWTIKYVEIFSKNERTKDFPPSLRIFFAYIQ